MFPRCGTSGGDPHPPSDCVVGTTGWEGIFALFMSNAVCHRVLREKGPLLRLLPLEVGRGPLHADTAAPPVCFEEFWKLSECVARTKVSSGCLAEYTSFLMCLRAHGVLQE